MIATTQFWSDCFSSEVELDVVMGASYRFDCGQGRLKFVDATNVPIVDVTCDGQTKRLFLMAEQQACNATFQSIDMWRADVNNRLNATLLIRFE